MAGDPSSILFAGINNAFKLAKFCIELKEASEEVRVFGKLINRVRKDRAEAIRERRKTAPILDLSPQKRNWIDGTIADVDNALFQIGLLLEDARIDRDVGKSVTLQHRFEWVISIKGEFLVKHLLLSTCHQSLLSAITAMDSIKLSRGDLLSPPLSSEAEEMGENRDPLRPPGQRRRRHKSGSFITYEPVQLQSFADEYDEALSQRGSGELEKGVLISDEYLDSKSLRPPSPDEMWDEIDPKEMLKAAVEAIERQGEGTKSVSTLASSLLQFDMNGTTDERAAALQDRGGASGRRRKLAARLADT